MTPPIHIWLIGDGKSGHENQSAGLAEAIGRFVPMEIRRVSAGARTHVISRIREANRASCDWPKPDLLIGTGHATHTVLLWLARHHGVPCVVLMKPSLPTSMFDLCLVPVHDLNRSSHAANVIPTVGALNLVPPPGIGGRTTRLILIGGPSAGHGWDQAALLEVIGEITGRGGDSPWHITDSRRTPDDFLSAAARICPNAELHPHRKAGTGWLPSLLSDAAEVWVTEDSISMIYEALSSGARVGLLPVPRKKSAGRVARGVDRLADEGYVTRFTRWQTTGTLLPPPRILREADRCAKEVLERLFPDVL